VAHELRQDPLPEAADLHRSAAARHELAAEHHDRCASYWDLRHEPAHAELQRDLAAHERSAAELERRWMRLPRPSARPMGAA
jgi:hypothetical protein